MDKGTLFFLNHRKPSQIINFSCNVLVVVYVEEDKGMIENVYMKRLYHWKNIKKNSNLTLKPTFDWEITFHS